MTKLTLLLATLALLPVASVALAEEHAHDDHQFSGDKVGGDSRASATGIEDMPGDVGATMQLMPMESTDNVDVDYLMMVLHRQAAIDMACV